jgi:hypothetical protein
LGDNSLREISRYNVSPFGSIQHNCRHIPYNSGKKDFFDKTGRESFEGRLSAPFPKHGSASMRKRLTSLPSLPVHLQCPKRRYRVHRHVGLQRRSCSHDPFLQVLQLPKGIHA